MFSIPTAVQPAINDLISHGALPMVVGGAVRDYLFTQIHNMNLVPKDFDFEIFGITPTKLQEILSCHGDINLDGQSFASFHLHLDGEIFDFSIPRRDRKVGIGHKDFEASFHPNMSFSEAALRRDFTINAVGFNVAANEFVDPHGGIKDIENKQLQPVSSHFKEDALRILRGFQFVSRFDLKYGLVMVAYANILFEEFHALPRERIQEEWLKWATKSIVPHKGLDFLVHTGWIAHFPELNDLRNVPQDNVWHPEGDVFKHTKHVVHAMSVITEDMSDTDRKAKLMFGALCHDFGKALTTEVCDDGRIIAPNHAAMGVEPASNFMNRMFKSDVQKDDPEITQFVVDIVKYHMDSGNFIDGNKRHVRRLARKLQVATLNDMAEVVAADVSGRPFTGTIHRGIKADAMAEFAHRDFGDNSLKPTNILMGRHLIELGLKPGPIFGVILKEAEEAQDNDEFDNLGDAKKWAVANIPPIWLNYILDEYVGSKHVLTNIS